MAASTTVTGSGIGLTMFTSEAEAVSSQVTAARHRLLMLKKQREELKNQSISSQSSDGISWSTF